MTVTRDALKISRQISGLLPGISELLAGDDKPGSEHSRSQDRATKRCLSHCLQCVSNSDTLIKAMEQ